MFKKIISVVAALSAAMAITLCAGAQAAVKIVDNAEILTPAQEKTLTEKIDKLVLDYGVDAVIYTTPSLGGEKAADYEQRVFDETGCGIGAERDGILLLLVVDPDTNRREYFFGTHGWANGAGITEYGTARIGKLIAPKLNKCEYGAACEEWLNLSGKFLKAGKKGSPYTEEHTYRTELDVALIFGVWAAVGIAAALLVCFLAKRSMRSVGGKRAAVVYVKKGSFSLTNQRDILLFSKTDKTAKSRNEPEPKKTIESENESEKNA